MLLNRGLGSGPAEVTHQHQNRAARREEALVGRGHPVAQDALDGILGRRGHGVGMPGKGLLIKNHARQEVALGAVGRQFLLHVSATQGHLRLREGRRADDLG